MVDVGEGNGIDPKTVVYYHALLRFDISLYIAFLYFVVRDVIGSHLLASSANAKIGGVGTTVEIDESMFGKGGLKILTSIFVQGRENTIKENTTATGGSGF